MAIRLQSSVNEGGDNQQKKETYEDLPWSTPSYFKDSNASSSSSSPFSSGTLQRTGSFPSTTTTGSNPCVSASLSGVVTVRCSGSYLGASTPSPGRAPLRCPSPFLVLPSQSTTISLTREAKIKSLRPTQYIQPRLALPPRISGPPPTGTSLDQISCRQPGHPVGRERRGSRFRS